MLIKWFVPRKQSTTTHYFQTKTIGFSQQLLAKAQLQSLVVVTSHTLQRLSCNKSWNYAEYSTECVLLIFSAMTHLRLRGFQGGESLTSHADTILCRWYDSNAALSFRDHERGDPLQGGSLELPESRSGRRCQQTKRRVACPGRWQAGHEDGLCVL